MEPARTSVRPCFERRRASTRADLLRLDHYLSLGSNVEPGRHIPACLRLLGTAGRVLGLSGLWRTAPVGPVPQADFHNLALCLRSPLSPLLLLDRCQSFERQLGRRPRQRWGPREIDIDLLLCHPEVRIFHPRLELPHPRLSERAFVLRPLLELCGDLPWHRQVELRSAAYATSGQRAERLGELAEIYDGIES